MSTLKRLALGAVRWVRNLGAFSLGMFVGTCYGSVVASIVSYAVLMGYVSL
jgi:hypothetical protein